MKWQNYELKVLPTMKEFLIKPRFEFSSKRKILRCLKLHVYGCFYLKISRKRMCHADYFEFIYHTYNTFYHAFFCRFHYKNFGSFLYRSLILILSFQVVKNKSQAASSRKISCRWFFF